MESKRQDHTAGYLAICIDDVPSDFRPSSSSLNFSDSVIDVKEVFVWLANLYTDNKRLKDATEIIQNWEKTSTMDSEGFSQLTKMLMPIIINSRLVDFISSYTFGWYKSAKRADRKFGPGLGVACMMAEQFASLLCDPTGTRESGLTNAERFECIIGTMDDAGYLMNATYRPIFGYCGNKFTYLNAVTFKDMMSVIYFSALSILKDEIIIRKCQNCGDYFLPRSRSDEIYCDKQLPNGRTCKTVGYDTKIKQDQVLYEYRKIYKTQNARKQRNKQKTNIDDRFKRWVIFAKAMLIKCQSGEIDLDEMIAVISSDDWIKREV